MSAFVLFDTEYTAWEGSWERQWSYPEEYREIIQIAAVIVQPQQGFKISAELTLYIKPKVNPKLSNYIAKLTGITQEQIEEEGISFLDGLAIFYQFTEKNNLPIYCWGNDEDVFKENCSIHNLNFGHYFSHFYDIREVFSSAGINTKHYESGTVCQTVGKVLNPQHRAQNDVNSMLLTLQHLAVNGHDIRTFLKKCSYSGTGNFKTYLPKE